MSKKSRVEHYYTEQPTAPARYGIIQTTLRGIPFEFLTASGVFSTRQIDAGTRIFIENMQLPQTGTVLDVGCGYGAIGITAAKLNSDLQVVLTDINQRAVQLARQNAQKNHVRNVKAKHGNLYAPVQDQHFDCVLSNPPVSAGMETVQTIILQAPAVMNPNATLQMVVRSKIGKKTLPETFMQAFGNVEVLAIKSGYRVLMAKNCL
ncbi:MAG: class I SAM-dependent methyltransferase [Candidatus Bathyarchaeota archaeon]|nr:class I SAM-dependent methyltransferase [Candidatus Bathyarchaeota archaeon]